MKLNNLKLIRQKHRSIYFKKRNAHLFKKNKFFNRYYSKLKENTKSQFNYKLPILTCIELAQDHNSSNVPINSENNSVLYNDYLLISSKTKYKYLLRTLYEQVNLDSKDSFTIIDGFLQIKNWEPISLSSISSIKQCFRFEAKNVKDKLDQNGSIDVNSKESNNGDIEDNDNCQINESSDICSSSKSNLSENSYQSENNAKNSSITVYDLLSHVVSFATIRIIVKNSSSEDMQSQYTDTNLNQDNNFIQDEKEMDDDKEAIDTGSPRLSTAPNYTSMLYSNPQFASLLPLFNLPIISQFLNGIKNQQEKKDFTSFSEDFSTDTDNQFNQQPLNLCKDVNKNVNSKKINQNLSVNTNKIQNNNIGFDNASPSPSLSTTSSNSSSNCSKVANIKQIDSMQSLNSKIKREMITNEQMKILPGQSQIKVSYGNRRQRERTTFDPQEEITRLMQVFEKTHHPTRFQIANICDFLNSLACRKDKKPLEPYNIQYWFKNARAALRRKVKGDNQNSNFELNTKVASTLKDEEFLNKVLNTKPSSHSLDSKFTDNIDLSGENSDQNYEDSVLDEDELNDDEETNLNDNYDSNYEYQNSGSENGFNKNNDKENLENVENNNSYEECEYQDDLSVDGDDNNQEITNNSSNNFNSNSSPGSKNRNSSNGSRRNRVFIDPISEVPILEHYFSIETYPDHYLIEKICENLNKGEYRYKFPKLESRNIQLWFKNHRAKLKRLKTNPSCSSLNQNQSNPVS